MCSPFLNTTGKQPPGMWMARPGRIDAEGEVPADMCHCALGAMRGTDAGCWDLGGDWRGRERRSAVMSSLLENLRRG